VGSNLEDLTYVMQSRDGLDEHYIRLVSIHAGRKVRQAENSIKGGYGYDRGYVGAITDYATKMWEGLGKTPTDIESLVRLDIERVMEAIRADHKERENAH
jgi:hypothetical protein